MISPEHSELLTALLQLGLRAHEQNKFADPSTDQQVSEAGLLTVTNLIEDLGHLGVISDVQPMFGSGGGMWIGFKLSESTIAKIHSDGLEAVIMQCLGTPDVDTNKALQNLIDRIEQNIQAINVGYRDDFIATLKEIKKCFDADCFIASNALCGKILEVCLKQKLVSLGKEIPNRAMLGQLIAIVRDETQVYIDPALSNIADLINRNRIPAVHAIERIEIPSVHQAAMVIHATIDTCKRTIDNLGP